MQDITNQNSEEENNDLLNLDDTSGYQLPEQKSIVLDLAQNKVLDSKDFSHIQMIYMTAKEKGIKIKEFPINENGAIDSGCRKAGCYGRGYKGFAGNIPIPCDCLFEAKNIQSDGVSVNRKTIRNYNKIMGQETSKYKNTKMAELGIKPIGNDLYGKIKKGTKSELLKYRWKEHEGKWNFSRVYDTPVFSDMDFSDNQTRHISEEERERLASRFKKFIEDGEVL